MNKNIAIILTVAAGAFLAGCNDNEDHVSEASKTISVTASIGSMTRVAYDGDKSTFMAGDSLALFAWTGLSSEIPTEGLIVNNVVNKLQSESGLWTPATQMLWDDMTTPHYFMAVAPARQVASFTADPYTLDPSAEKYQQSDLLIATNIDGLVATNNPVALNFKHAMAKLNVNLSFRNQWTEGNPPSQTQITEAKIQSVVGTAKDHATIDYLNMVVTATGENANVALNKKTNATWTTLMIPQDAFNTITITLNGNDEWLGGNGTYVFAPAQPIPLESGKITTVNLIVGRDQITLDKNGITIENWGNGVVVDNGEAQIPEN